jgi:crossover junction endodeoxyribonuclease RuvC
MQAILGIDPGISGAAMLLRGDCVTLVGDMPVADVRGRKTIDPAAVVAMIRAAGTINMAVLEHVQGVQQAGATSAFSFGRGFGLLEGVLAGLGVPTTLVRPQVWTKALGVSRDKGSHRLAAGRLWPSSAHLFSRVKDDGRADAALLCHWWVRNGIGG